MKKLLSVFFSIVILITSLTCVPFVVKAASDYTSGGLSCTLDANGVFTVSVSSGGNGRGEDYSKNKYMTGVNTPWYFKRDKIKKVVINEGVLQIGSYWFYGCSNLTSITFADSVNTIGVCCFGSCTALTSVQLPKNCYWYYKELFLDCTSLKWAFLPNGNSTNSYSGKIPEGTFNGCTSLEEVYVGSGHTAMDAKAFYDCGNLKGVVWSSGTVNSVGKDALYNVPSSCKFYSNNNALSSWASSNSKSSGSLSGPASTDGPLKYSYDTSTFALKLSDSGDMAPYDNGIAEWRNFHYLITSLTCPQTESYSLGSRDFQGCENLKSIDFGSNLRVLGWESFAQCTALTSVNIPNSVVDIWSAAFQGCTSIDTVVFNDGGDKPLHIYPYAFEGLTSSTYWLDIPSNTAYIDDHAFYNTNFNYVKILTPQVTVGEDAFGCIGYARFFGLHDSGFYDFVKAGRDKSYNWFYFCLNENHSYVTDTIAPSCLEEGYDLYHCPYCDVDSSKSNFTNPAGHKYSQCATKIPNDGIYVYSCSACGETSLSINSYELLINFEDAISHENDNPAFYQSNYFGQYDVDVNGYINARDFMLIGKATKNVSLDGMETTIDTATTYQTIEGFGASGAWWAQAVGTWSDSQIDRVTELLYGETGAGLDNYRYNLGGGSQDDTKIGDWTRRAEDFLSSSSDINNASTYDWNADLAARKVLASARLANPNLKVTLFSNSAPVSITDNGKAYCSNGATKNLSESNYQSFANYVANCAEHFIDEGYNVVEVSPINEPEWEWACDASGNASQEGCHYTAADARNFYNKYMVPTLQSREKLNGKVELAVWECAQLNHTDSKNYKLFLPYMFHSGTNGAIINKIDYGSNNTNIRDYVNTLDTHSYWASTADREKVASDIGDSNYSAIQKVKCSEYCQMTNDKNSNVLGHIQAEGGSTNGMSIAYGLALADIMYQDLTILNASSWDWWTACAPGVYPDGLIYVDYNNPDNIRTSKRLWVMGNYARFIEDGAKRVKVTGGSNLGKNITTKAENIYSWTIDKSSGTDKNNYFEQTAYLNPDGSVVVVYINNSNTTQYTTFDAGAYKTFETYVTDNSRDLEQYQSGNVTNSVVIIPEMSVTTVVLK